MSHFVDHTVRNDLKKLVGENCEPTQELEKMLIEAYLKGRSDTLLSLGVEEDDLSNDAPLMAWTA